MHIGRPPTWQRVSLSIWKRCVGALSAVTANSRWLDKNINNTHSPPSPVEFSSSPEGVDVRVTLGPLGPDEQTGPAANGERTHNHGRSSSITPVPIRHQLVREVDRHLPCQDSMMRWAPIFIKSYQESIHSFRGVGGACAFKKQKQFRFTDTFFFFHIACSAQENPENKRPSFPARSGGW